MSGIFNILGNTVKELAVSRFQKPTLVQELAIPKIIEGRNVLVIAETGSGKTESTLLPIFSKLTSAEYAPIAVLYVTPLKSLNRDLLDRLLWWCNKLDIDVAVRHGDTNQYERKMQVEHPPHILISTMEQIGAMIVGKRFREHLKNIKFIVIDEIHEVVNSKRGVQLTLSLERLKKLCGNPQLICLSATVGNPDLAAKFIFSENSYEIVNAISPKSIELKVESPYPTKEDEIIAEKIFIGGSVVARLRKIRNLILEHRSTLAFTNTREAAEILSSRLRLLDKNFPHDIHHSSLSKEVRIKAEKDFKEEKLKALVCVSGDSKVLTRSGIWKKITDMNNESILSISKSLKYEECSCGSILKKGKKSIFELKTNLGFKIRTTANHRFMTIGKNSKIEWKELRHLKPNDAVAIFNGCIKGNAKEFLEILPEETYVKIKEGRVDKVKSLLKAKGITYRELAMIVSCKESQIKNFIGRKKFAMLSLAKSVFRYLGMSLCYEDIINLGSRNYNKYIFPKYVDYNFARFMGFLLSDGTITGNGRIRLFNNNRKLLREFETYLMDNFGIDSRYKTSSWDTTSLEAEAVWLGNLLAGIGVARGRKARTLTVPDIIFSLPMEHRYNFLSGYFDGDGNHKTENGRLVSMIFNTYSKKAAEDIHLLLLGLDIVSSLRKNKRKEECHVEIIGGKHLKRFIDNCKVKKINYGDFITEGGYSNVDVIYNLGHYLKSTRLKTGISTYRMRKEYGTNPIRYEYGERSISEKQLKRILEIYSRYTEIDNEIMSLIGSDIFWDKIEYITPAGKEEIYDVIDNKNNNFISNGFVLHNCTSSLQLGIDIGTVDLVLQYQSPRTVTQLIQRVGRSGHGIGRLSKGIIIASEGDDIFESCVISRKALRGELEPLRIHQKSFDVLTQQIIGFLIENYNIDPKETYETIKKAYPFRDLKEEEFSNLVNFLDTQLRLVFIDNGIKRRRKAFEYYFDNLSVIPDQKNYKVIDTTSNTFVGTLDEEFIASHGDVGSSFIVKGRPWKILSVEDGKVLVEGVEDIESAIPAWEGELIPVPFDVAQEVGILRREIKNMLEESLSNNEIIEKIKKKYPVSSQSTVRMIQLIKRQIKKYPLPDEKNIFIERFQDYIVLHALFGSLVNETLSRFISAILSAEHGEIVTSKTDPYRIILKGCNPEEIKKILFDYKPEDVEILLEKSLPKSSLFKFRFIHVAKRFGAISKKASFDTINLDRLIDVYWNSPIHKETLQEIFTEKLDLDKTKEILEKIQNKEIKINTFEGLSPLAELGFRYELQDVARPDRPEKEIFKIFKNRLLNSKVRLLCINCGKYSIVEIVKDIKELRCSHCQSKLIAVLKPHREEAQHIVKKWLKGVELTEEEKVKLEFIKKSADLVIDYGKDAAIVLAGRGIGPQTAIRVLYKPRRNEDDLYKHILEAEREWIKNKRFWT